MKKIAQAILSSMIFLLFIVYVFAIQENYDSNNIGWQKALLFASVIFSGGVSYDIAKHLVYLSSDVFWEFGRKLFKATKALMVGFFLIIIITVSFAYEQYWIMSIFCLALLISMYLFVNHVTDAVEYALEDRIDSKEINAAIKLIKAYSASLSREKRLNQK